MYIWGKNDQGQLGIGSGIGFDLIESEKVPMKINFQDDVKIQDIYCGQNSMAMLGNDGNVYRTGLKLYYSPSVLEIPPEFEFGKINLMTSGAKHYLVVDGMHFLLSFHV